MGEQRGPYDQALGSLWIAGESIAPPIPSMSIAVRSNPKRLSLHAAFDTIKARWLHSTASRWTTAVDSLFIMRQRALRLDVMVMQEDAGVVALRSYLYEFDGRLVTITFEDVWRGNRMANSIYANEKTVDTIIESIDFSVDIR